jgi:hypothetical protein
VNLTHLETVHVKLLSPSHRSFFEFPVEIEDRLDKDVMSLIKHILTSRKQTLKVWNVFYPVKAGYLKTLSHALEPFFFGQEQPTIEMINGIRVKEAREFLIERGVIEVDHDSQYSLISKVSHKVIHYDNFKYNQTFTSMMNSFYIDIIKKVYGAMQRHSIPMKISFDGTTHMCLQETVSRMIDENGTFNLHNFSKEVLNQPIIIQSNVLIIMALLFLENSNLIKLNTLNFENCLLYDVDMMYMLTYL